MKNQALYLGGLFLWVILIVSACGIRVANGSGNVISESRVVSDFDTVSFEGFGELMIQQGAAEGLVVETDDNLLPFISTNVSGGTLTIGMTNDTLRPILRPSESIRYVLTVKSLKQVDLSGAGIIEIDGVNAENFVVASSGAGEIHIAKLAADELTVTMSGAGTVEVAGEVGQQSVELSGLGTYEAGDLASERANVQLSGAGSATIWVNGELDAEISGAGAINYYGAPRVGSQVSGVGSIKNLGKK